MKVRFFGDPLWDVSRVTAPWGDRPPIYRHILSHLRSDGSGLGEGGERLPDEEIVRGESGIGWVAGGLDGAFGHHGGGGEPTQTARSILRASSR
jgi:hypothetical protein